jgi:hypothetical protein
MDDYSETLIQQIDTILRPFFKFCFHACPTKKTLLNVVEVEWVLDIFTEDFITFKSDSSEIVSKIEHN